MYDSEFILQAASILDERGSSFPDLDNNFKIIIGKTVFKNNWFRKAIVLCKNKKGEINLRFYTWQRTKNGFKVRQKFGITILQLEEFVFPLVEITQLLQKHHARQQLEYMDRHQKEQEEKQRLKVDQLRKELLKSSLVVKSEE